MATGFTEPPTLQEMVEELRIPPFLLEQTCSDDHLKSISPFLDWRRVAPHLGLSETDIEEEIEFGKKTGSEKRLKTAAAKYCDLVQVLLKVGNADHAERVCRLLQPAEVTSQKGDSPSPGTVTASSNLTLPPHCSPTVLARQQLPITESETLSITAISPVKTIENEIQELEDQFLEVVNETEDFLENSQQLKKVKRCITQLPVSIRHQHIKFLQSSLTAINSAGSVSEVFAILGLYWDFLNCGLLREIIRKLGDCKTKQLMDEYSEKLRAFREHTKLGDFINKWTGDCNFCHKEFCLEMGEEWRERTLEDLENFRMRFSRQVSFTDYAVLIRTFGSGSVTVSWVLQGSYPLSAALFLGALQLLHRSNVRRVTSNEEVILDLTLPNVIRHNLASTALRGERLEDLRKKPEHVQHGTRQQQLATVHFRKGKRKMNLCIILIVIILVVIIIGIAVPLATK